MKKFNILVALICVLLCASCQAKTGTEQTELTELTATTITTAVTENAEPSVTTSSITSDTEESADSEYVSDVSDDDNEHALEEYLASIDWTNEADVMSDEVLRSLVSERHKKAQDIMWIFEAGVFFNLSSSDREVEPYCDENGAIYDAILTDKCHSMNDLWSYISSLYVEDVVDELKNDVERWKIHDDNRFVEANGYIYLRQGGKCASSSDPETIEIVSLEESKITYSALFLFYDGEEEEEIYTISKYDNGWKYDELIY